MRHWTVTDNALDHSAIGVGLGNNERHWTVTDNALDHSAIVVGLGNNETLRSH